MSARFAALAALLLLGAGAPAPVTLAGDGTVYVGTYSKKILVLDEATLTVRHEIPLSVGIPFGIFPSFDKTKLYVLDARFEHVEIIDVASRRATGSFTLSTPQKQVRMAGINVDPTDRFAVLLVKIYTKKLDRYEISAPTLLKYDLARRVVTDTIPWPKGEERDFAQILFSPAGDLMYFFTSDDVLIYDSATLKQVDRWELSRTMFEDGLGRINFGFGGDLYDEPGFYTGLFRSTDPVNRRTMMGVARVDLTKRSVDFYTLGPSAPVGFAMAPGKKRAYGIRNEVGDWQFWTFDLEARRVTDRVSFAGRPRMGLTVGSSGEVLYVHTAGHTIDVYDVTTFRKLRTVELDDDMTDFVLIPAAPPRPGN